MTQVLLNNSNKLKVTVKNTKSLNYNYKFYISGKENIKHLCFSNFMLVKEDLKTKANIKSHKGKI